MSRVVADTNVLLSALLFGGLPGAFLNLAFARKFSLITSPTLLEELNEKLLFKFKRAASDIAVIRHKFEEAFEIVSTLPNLSVIKDDQTTIGSWSVLLRRELTAL